MIRTIKRFRAVVANRASIFKTIYYNMKYLPLHQARYFPITIAKGVTIIGNGKIVLDFDPSLNNNRIYFGGKALNWMPEPSSTPTVFYIEGVMHIKAGFYFGSGGGIEVDRDAVLSFGNNFNATAKCTIICRNSISFGDNVLTSWDTLIMDSDQHTIIKLMGKENKNYDGSIQIGNDVWISSKVTILKNTVISRGSVIGSNTVMHGKFEREKVLIAGNPAKIYRENVTWKQERPGRSLEKSQMYKSI